MFIIISFSRLRGSLITATTTSYLRVFIAHHIALHFIYFPPLTSNALKRYNFQKNPNTELKFSLDNNHPKDFFCRIGKASAYIACFPGFLTIQAKVIRRDTP